MTQSATATPHTVLIADDHEVLRAGLRALFGRYPYLKVVGEADRGTEVLRLAQQLVPDLVLLDINIRDLDGIAVTEALGRDLPAIRIVVLSAVTDVELLRSALRAGARGYIVKTASESELMEAIEAVLRGDLYLHPSVIRAFLTAEMLVEPENAETPATGALTTREQDVMRLLCDGYTNAQIAADLHVSVRTVETHRGNIAQKLGTRSRAEMVRLANADRPERSAKLRSM